MKMEEIELYPHNQKAYDNLCAMLRDNNRLVSCNQPARANSSSLLRWHRTIREKTFFF